MSYHVDEPHASVGRSAVDELSFLARKGATDKALGSCQALEEAILRGLGPKLVDPLPKAARIELLRKALNDTLVQARQQGLDLIEGPDPPTLADSAEVPALQVAAAGELLRITDESFNKIRDIRCEQFDVRWSDIEGMPDNQGEQPRRQLRAAIWIGRRSSRSLRPRRLRRPERELLEALLEWLESYAEKNQAELRVLNASKLGPPADPIAEPSALLRSSVGSHSQVVSRRHSRRLMLAGLAVVTVGALVTIWAVLQLDDDPADSPESGPDVSIPNGSEPEITRLAQVAPCGDLPLDSPLAKDLRANNQAIVDGRCHQYPSAPVGAQAGPHRRYPGVDHLNNGEIIDDICLVPEGQPTSNKIGQRSRIWVRYRLDSGGFAFTPAIWVQGEEGAQRCSA